MMLYKTCTDIHDIHTHICTHIYATFKIHQDHVPWSSGRVADMHKDAYGQIFTDTLVKPEKDWKIGRT